MKLRDRVAVVTGASSGIGRAIAIELAAAGARVAVVDIREQPKQGKYHDVQARPPTAQAITAGGGAAFFVQADLSDPAAVDAVVRQTVARHGGIDILVNNAGIYIAKSREDHTLEDWDRTIDLNLRAVFYLTHVAAPYLKRSRHGRIIHIASVHAFGGGGGPAYPSAKAALVNLARDHAIEFAPTGGTANSICPGYIETPIQDYLTPEQIEGARRRTLLPRFGRPEDIAKAVAFLASDDAEWITGANLVVDGGFTAPL